MFEMHWKNMLELHQASHISKKMPNMQTTFVQQMQESIGNN
jgi:hypothetical protein